MNLVYDLPRNEMNYNRSEGFIMYGEVTAEPPGDSFSPSRSFDSFNVTVPVSTSSSSSGSFLKLADDNLTLEGRARRLNLTLLNLGLSPVFPSLEAVSKDMQAFLICIYSLAAVLSLVGNITVILVLAFGRRSSVRCYLINLAIADINMATFCIPFSYTSFMFHRWIFAPEFCRIVAFMQHVSVTCSVYTLVAIGVDRYKALIHPLNNRWTKSRSRYVIGGIWVFSLVISLASLVISDTQRFDWDGEWYYECKENWPHTPNEVYEKTYTVLLFVLTFALPVIGLGYTYLSIVGMMCSYKMPGNAEPSRDQQHLQAKVKVINMMITVMVCFVLCWFPLQVLQFLVYFAPEITTCRGNACFTYYMSFFACHWLAMANSFMNPFIYCFMSKNFREDLLQFIRKCRRKRIRRTRSTKFNRSDLGSSFRSILYITHKTSVQSSTKTSFLAKSDKSREADIFELRSLQDKQEESSCKKRSFIHKSKSSGKNDYHRKLGESAVCFKEALPGVYNSTGSSTNSSVHYRNHLSQHHRSYQSQREPYPAVTLSIQNKSASHNSKSTGTETECSSMCHQKLAVMDAMELTVAMVHDDISNELLSSQPPTLSTSPSVELSETLSIIKRNDPLSVSCDAISERDTNSRCQISDSLEDKLQLDFPVNGSDLSHKALQLTCSENQQNAVHK
ncbi:prolactin-releasing peptide receptor-like [Palaemon carinicauda]|uniref:prolactin-releasing peptide receptor-like n=1 Tax=Palaemon carinicauda TaxID=392227 RepID=UPI0035B69B1E